jgi:hypothetical protein
MLEKSIFISIGLLGLLCVANGILRFLFYSIYRLSLLFWNEQSMSKSKKVTLCTSDHSYWLGLYGVALVQSLNFYEFQYSCYIYCFHCFHQNCKGKDKCKVKSCQQVVQLALPLFIPILYSDAILIMYRQTLVHFIMNHARLSTHAPSLVAIIFWFLLFYFVPVLHVFLYTILLFTQSIELDQQVFYVNVLMEKVKRGCVVNAIIE